MDGDPDGLRVARAVIASVTEPVCEMDPITLTVVVGDPEFVLDTRLLEVLRALCVSG